MSVDILKTKNSSSQETTNKIYKIYRYTQSGTTKLNLVSRKFEKKILISSDTVNERSRSLSLLLIKGTLVNQHTNSLYKEKTIRDTHMPSGFIGDTVQLRYCRTY